MNNPFLNPKNENYSDLDSASKELMLKTLNFFETKGRGKLRADDMERIWYADFIDFVKKERVFATLLTPKKYNLNNEHARWDTYRNTKFSEILGFYGLPYWYVWQVTILGLGPFGLSEKEHGADIRSNTMLLTKQEDGTYLANGRKYYIGNGNKAAFVSTQGKIEETGEFVFFVVDSQHKKYTCVKNTVNSQSFVAEYELSDYVITEDDILGRGREAWDLALSTVNVGKYNLGWGSIGMCSHAFYESIQHASNRRIFARNVTDFPHIKQLFMDAYSRLTAMKLYATRTSDYMRTASSEDRRYLLYDPIMKMYVTLQGEDVINHLWDIIAAKGFEKDMFFEMAARDIRALPKLEGTVHVNMILIIRFMKNYFFSPDDSLPEIGRITNNDNDDFLFNQGSSQKKLNKIYFHGYTKIYDEFDLPNINIFKKQIEVLKEFLTDVPPTKEQHKDIDYMLVLGKMFTMVVYGQLILEGAKIENTDKEVIDHIFNYMVRDFSKNALEMYSKFTSSEGQEKVCLKMIQKPTTTDDKFHSVFDQFIHPLKDAYQMND